MSTTADSETLRNQAESLRAAAKALEPKLGDPEIPADERMQLFAQFQALHSQAFSLTTKAAENIVMELSVNVDNLRSTINEGTQALATIQRVKDVIDIATSIVQLGAAVATGQPAGIAQAFGDLQTRLAAARPRRPFMPPRHDGGRGD